MSISNWFYEHSFGLIGTKDAPSAGGTQSPKPDQSSSAAGGTGANKPNDPVDPNDPSKKDDGFLATLKTIWKYVSEFFKLITDYATGGFGAVIGDAIKFFTDGPDAKGGTQNTSASNGNRPSIINRVENWIGGRAAPAASVEVVRDAALKGGLQSEDAAALATIVQGESGWDRYAHNPGSTAKGWFQFLDATARAVGIRDPFDPVQSSEGAVRYYKDIRQYLADHVYGGDITKVKPADIKLGWAYGESGAAHLLTGDQNASAVEALTQAGQSNAESAIGGNLTKAFKDANPNWGKMSKGQLVSVVEDEFNAKEQGVITANAAALHMTPPAPGANPPKPEVLADARPPQPAAPQPQQGRGPYRNMNVPIESEDAALNIPKTANAQPIDAGRKKVVPEVDLPAAG